MGSRWLEREIGQVSWAIGVCRCCFLPPKEENSWRCHLEASWDKRSDEHTKECASPNTQSGRGQRAMVACKQTTGDLGEVPHRARLGTRLRGRCITQLHLWRNVCQGPKKKTKNDFVQTKTSQFPSYLLIFCFLSFSVKSWGSRKGRKKGRVSC